MLKRLLLGSLLVSCICACVHEPKVTSNSVTANQSNQPPDKTSDQSTTIDQADIDPNCVLATPTGEKVNIPSFLSQGPLVVTNMLKPCEDPATGQQGFLKQSPWTAMGFPCTAGRAQYDWKGSVYNPKLLIFPLTNACPMDPSNPELIAQLVRQHFGLSPKAPMMAYFPFSVMYWELADGSDADTSNQIEIVTAGNYAFRWKDFQGQQALQVRLFGKQNSFTPSPTWYEVDAGIVRDLSGSELFKLVVESVQILDESGLKEVKQRCLDLRPRRRCHQVFGH